MEGFNWSILGWIAGLIFVYVFGLFEGRGQGRKRRIEEEKEEQKEQPKPLPVKIDDPSLLRIKNEEGTMTLDLDGKRVVPTSLTPQQRKRLIEMLNIMRPWLEGKPASVPAPASPPPPRSTPATPTRQRASTSPSAASSVDKEEEQEASPTSIVGQINLILQKNIANTNLASRGVSLMESLAGGVNVYVGVQRYNMVDDVPDEEIKSAIRAAISEWEDTSTPGLS